jgi:hypothetical protein
VQIDPIRPPGGGQSAEAAWRDHARPLAAWADRALVHRRDAFGGQYIDRDGNHRRTTRKEVPGLRRLATHFAAAGAEDIVGLHVTAPDETCRWVVADIDAHPDDNADPAANLRLALHIYAKAGGAGLSPLLVDSDGAGGFHVWAVFRDPVPAATAWRLGKWLALDHAEFGFAKPPETFPKKPVLTGKRFGGWVRLPGRHHKRDHWSRVWDGRRWLEGEEAVRAILAIRPTGVDPAGVVPADFDPMPRRTTPTGRARRPRPASSASPTRPRPRDVTLAREALRHLDADYRDDYDAWLRVGLALRQLGEAGRALWHDWSAASPKYVADVLDAKWEGFDAGGGPGQLALGSLFHWAEGRGWERRPARPRGGDGRAPRMRRTRFTIPLASAGVSKPEGG